VTELFDSLVEAGQSPVVAPITPSPHHPINRK